MYLLQLSNTVSTDGKKSPKLRFLPIFWNNNSQNASMKVKGYSVDTGECKNYNLR